MKYLIVSNEHSSRVIVGEEKDLINILDVHNSTMEKIVSSQNTLYQEYLYDSRRPASDFGITKTVEANKRQEELRENYNITADRLVNSYELYHCNMYLQESISTEEFLNAQNKLDLLIDN